MMSKNLIPAQDPFLSATASHRATIILLHSNLQLYAKPWVLFHQSQYFLHKGCTRSRMWSSSVAHGLVVEFTHVLVVNTVFLPYYNHGGWTHHAWGLSTIYAYAQDKRWIQLSLQPTVSKNKYTITRPMKIFFRSQYRLFSEQHQLKHTNQWD